MTPEAQVDALATLAPRYAPADREQKLALLAGLARARLGVRALARWHETLCFLQAYPDDRRLLARVDEALATIPARVRRLGAAGQRRLRDSGISGTALDYPFGFPMAAWLAARFPRDTGIAWRRFAGVDRLDDVLPALVTHAEGEAFSDDATGPRAWLRVLRGRRRISDLALLVELFARARLAPAVRDALFEGLSVPVEWRVRGGAPSRTCARLPWPRPFFHSTGLDRVMSLEQAATRTGSPLTVASPALAAAVIDAARVAMATRARELFAFSYPNPRDVLVADPGRGLRVALVGLTPQARLPLEGYYAFFVLKNGVPVSYGGGWGMLGMLEIGVNVFESFRQGESALILGEVLRAYRQVFRMHTVVVDPYQIGHENPEALRSGAFYFYARLGFRSVDREIARLADDEAAKIAREPRYRTPLEVMARLAQAPVALSLGARPDRDERLSGTALASLVTRRIAHDFGGDRRLAVAADLRRLARVVQAPRWRRWPVAERRAFERFAGVAGLLRELEAWPMADRRRLRDVIRAKGGRSERDYLRALDAHGRLRASLTALAGTRAG